MVENLKVDLMLVPTFGKIGVELCKCTIEQ